MRRIRCILPNHGARITQSAQGELCLVDARGFGSFIQDDVYPKFKTSENDLWPKQLGFFWNLNWCDVIVGGGGRCRLQLRMNSYVFGCLDSETDAVPSNSQDRNFNIIRDDDFLIFLATDNKH